MKCVILVEGARTSGWGGHDWPSWQQSTFGFPFFFQLVVLGHRGTKPCLIVISRWWLWKRRECVHECVRERRQPEWLKSAAGCLSEGFSGLRLSWCQNVSRMENRKLDRSFVVKLATIRNSNFNVKWFTMSEYKIDFYKYIRCKIWHTLKMEEENIKYPTQFLSLNFISSTD